MVAKTKQKSEVTSQRWKELSVNKKVHIGVEGTGRLDSKGANQSNHCDAFWFSTIFSEVFLSANHIY